METNTRNSERTKRKLVQIANSQEPFYPNAVIDTMKSMGFTEEVALQCLTELREEGKIVPTVKYKGRLKVSEQADIQVPDGE